MCIEWVYFPRRQSNISFSYGLTAHIIPKPNQYSPKYFGTNSCRNIPFSWTIFPWNISAPTAAKRFHFPMDSVHMFPEPQAIFPTVFRCQEPPKYYIVMCIKCTYYSTGKTIFSTIFRPHLLGRIMFPGVFWHQRWVFPPDHDSGLMVRWPFLSGHQWLGPITPPKPFGVFVTWGQAILTYCS